MIQIESSPCPDCIVQKIISYHYELQVAMTVCIVHLNCTSQNSNDVPLAFFLLSVTAHPALFTSCCCSACKTVFLSLCVPSAFLFKTRNAIGWPKWLTGMPGHVYYHQDLKKHSFISILHYDQWHPFTCRLTLGFAGFNSSLGTMSIRKSNWSYFEMAMATSFLWNTKGSSETEKLILISVE